VRSGSRLGPGRPGKHLGPAHADFLENGSITQNVTDSGRLRSIVVNPSDATNIYVATAGGGVWRGRDADVLVSFSTAARSSASRACATWRESRSRCG
jgi:hypothetical protein